MKDLNYNITYKEIGDLCEKAEATLKSMKRNNPNQLELLITGALCKKYNISNEDIKLLIYLKEELKQEN